MKTLKVKFILFSLLAITATSLLTSCEQSSLIEIPEPTGSEVTDFRRDSNTLVPTLHSSNISVTPVINNDVIFRTILKALKGKANYNRGGYIELTEDDLGTLVYNSIKDAETLVLERSVTISETEAAEIFCAVGTDCLVGAYTFVPTKFELNILSDGTNTNNFCFELRPGYQVCIA